VLKPQLHRPDAGRRAAGMRFLRLIKIDCLRRTPNMIAA
jgi:hypothetical protein